MVTNELINYIRSQRKLGKSDTEIRDVLLSKNWPEKYIDQAFLIIEKDLNPQASHDLKATQAQASNNTLTSKTDTTKKNTKVVKAISVLFSLIALLYAAGAISLTAVIVIMDWAFGGRNLTFSFLRYFPTFAPVPVLFSLSAILFIYIGLKARNASRFSFWLASTLIVMVPFPLAFISQWLLRPFTQMASSFETEQSSTSSILKTLQGLRFSNPTSILSVVALVLLLFSYKKFRHNNEALSKKAKLFLTLSFMVLVVPIVSIVSLRYINAQDNDYGYTKAQSSVSYHVYRATLPEETLTNATKYTINKELAGKKNAVQVVYDLPFDRYIKTGETKLVILKQVGVDPPLDLQSIVSSDVPEPKSVEEISLAYAKNKKALLVSRTSKTTDINYLIYLTEDDVLIFIMSPKLTQDELLSFAESLK